jgi:hypothetical protein
MPANFQIKTNNPLTRDKYPSVASFLDTGVEGIFTAARDLIHGGARLINHPLSGSVKPNESPYKSLVLSAVPGTLDIESLQLIEGAAAVLKKLPVKSRTYIERVLEDFRVIDLDLLDSAVHALPPEYHF